MNAEEFIKAVHADDFKGKIDESNSSYRKVVLEYISDNTPCKIGIPYLIEDIGVRNDYAFHKKKNRAFVISALNVDFKPDGYPLIVASGLVYLGGESSKSDEDVVCTFRCIIHGSMGEVKLKQYIKK